MSKFERTIHPPPQRNNDRRLKHAQGDDFDVRITADDLKRYPQIAALVDRAAKRERHE